MRDDNWRLIEADKIKFLINDYIELEKKQVTESEEIKFTQDLNNRN